MKTRNSGNTSSLTRRRNGHVTRALRRATGWVACAVIASAGPSLMAQVTPNSHEIHLYAGWLFGSELTSERISNRTPELDDDFAFGMRYGYNFTRQWGVELSLGHNLNSATNLPGSDVDFGLTTIECNAIWHFTTSQPKWAPYLTFGAGYGWADIDQPIRGTVREQNVTIDGKDSFTANAGAGVKYFLNDRTMLRFDVRYRYLDKLVDSFDDSLNTVETTIGIGWRF